jgi:uncharacterized damage-inducible protein DinB
MKDPAFIQEMFSKAREAGEKVQQSFAALTYDQLNWKPAADAWSIGQCLDHLVVSDSLYFPAFKRITSGNFRMNWWQNWNPFSNLFAKMLITSTGERVNKKLKSPRVFTPTASDVLAGMVQNYQANLDKLTNYISECRNTDIDKVQITSPVSRVITYSLRSAITILVHHEHRHVNQAIKVMMTPGFPGA